MPYADFEYYTVAYRGSSITESEFERLILRASSYIDRITAGRASSTLPADPVKMAACAVAEAWQTNEQGGEMVSQSVGAWSRSYARGKPKSAEARLFDAAALYLSDLIAAARWC